MIETAQSPMPACPMAAMCKGMVRKPFSGIGLVMLGIVLIVLGVLIAVEPRILVWVTAAVFVLAGAAMLMMVGFIRKKTRGGGFQSMNNEKDNFAQKLDGISWALLLVWIGIALWADVGWGWGLVGVAAIILAGAVIRLTRKLPVEGFAVGIGIVFLAVGLWELFQVSWPLVPILVIACGVAVLWRTLRGLGAQGN